jgi:hypothetical protein
MSNFRYPTRVITRSEEWAIDESIGGVFRFIMFIPLRIIFHITYFFIPSVPICFMLGLIPYVVGGIYAYNYFFS